MESLLVKIWRMFWVALEWYLEERCRCLKRRSWALQQALWAETKIGGFISFFGEFLINRKLWKWNVLGPRHRALLAQMNGLWCQPETKICWKVALVAKSRKCLEIEMSPQSGAPGLDVVWSPLCPDVPITQVSHCTRLSSQVRLGIVQSHPLESGHKSQSCSTSPETSKRWVAQKF